MDPALLKERQAFLKKASTNVSVQQKPSAAPSHSNHVSDEQRKKKKKKPEEPEKAKPSTQFDYKSASSISNAANFAIMAKIVDYMKKRHLENQQWPISLKEALDEMKIYDVTKKQEAWLNEALPKNPKLQYDEEGKFTFKPPYKVKNRGTLLALLQKQGREGKGGILLSELNECVPKADDLVKSLGNNVVDVQTQLNKRKDHVYFYNDPETDYDVDEDFRHLWNQCTVSHLDENKIAEYLQKHGIASVKDLAPKRVMTGPLKRKAVKRRANQNLQNQHIIEDLVDYNM
uniref:Transcription initiation factor IIE subunit beta n=1 Tax=Acrobeloides nanus TaxID=290746 RepID=A0A914C4J8_9BILA